MAVDFSRRVNTDLSTTPFQYIVFGKDGGLLEVELNEAQMLAYERQKNTLKLLGDLYSNPSMFKYDSEKGVFSIEPGILSVNGYLINITDTVSIPNVTDGSYIYVTITTETVDKDSTIKKFGISSEENIENTIKDDRIGIETSRRESISVTIGTTSEDNSVLLGDISGTEFIISSEFRNIPKGFTEFGSLLTPVIALSEKDFENKTLIDIVTSYHSSCNAEKIVFLIKPSSDSPTVINTADFPVKIKNTSAEYYAILYSELVINGFYGKNTFKKSPYGGKLKWNLSYVRNDSTGSVFYDSPEWNYFGGADNQKVYSCWSKEFMVEVSGNSNTGYWHIYGYRDGEVIREPNVNGWTQEITAKDLLSFRRVEVDYTEMLASGHYTREITPKIQEDGTAESSFITWCVFLACGYIEPNPSWVTVKSTQSKTYDFSINFNQSDSEAHIIDLGCNTFTTGNSILSGTVSFILDEYGDYIIKNGYPVIFYSDLKISTKDGTSCFDLIYNSTDSTYKVSTLNESLAYNASKNMLLVNVGITSGDVNITSKDKSTALLNGTNTGNVNVFTTADVIPSGAYHLKLSNVVGALCVWDSTHSKTIIEVDNTEYTFVLTEPSKLFVGFSIGSGHSFTNFEVRGQLEKGTVATSFVPYNGKSNLDLTDDVVNLKNDVVNLKNDLGASNAGAHNSVYRGKYLGNALTTKQKAQISAGTFNDLYIGDYWTIGGVNYRIASFDYWLNSGDTNCTTHHVVIVPDSCLYNAQMNTSNITTGAYVGSAMYTSGLDAAKTTINNAFGSSHILSHREYLPNATKANADPTYESAGSWYDSTVELMNERMVYGADVFHNIEVNGAIPTNYTIDKSQLPLFALEPSRICNRAAWWLRDVVSAAYCASVGDSGGATHGNASYSFGVRPAFAIKG